MGDSDIDSELILDIVIYNPIELVG